MVTARMSLILLFIKALFFLTLKILLKLIRNAAVNGVEPRNNKVIQMKPQEAFLDDILPTSSITFPLISGKRRAVKF
jgi:hypothetical protein